MYNYQDVLDQSIETADSLSQEMEFGNILYQWLYPGVQQEKEFGQQVAMAKYENSQAYKDKFNALRDLGVNPLTAAQSLGSAVGASAPPSAIGEGANSLGAASGAVDTVGNLVDKFSSANERNTLLDDRRKNMIADTYLKYMSAGYTSEMSKGLAIANAYLPTEKFLGLLSLDASIDKLHAEYQGIMQDIEESKVRVKELDSRIALNIATGNLQDKLAAEAEKRAILIESQTMEQNWINKQMELYGINPRNPIESNIFLAGVREGRNSYSSQLGIIRDIQYNSASGQYDSDEEHAYSIAYSKALADAFASWQSRPSSTGSLIADASFSLGKFIQAHKKDPALKDSLRKQKEFNAAYSDFKAQLKKDLEIARKEYHAARKTMRRSEVNTAYGKYLKALNAYENMDEDAFEDLLLNQYGN